MAPKLTVMASCTTTLAQLRGSVDTDEAEALEALRALDTASVTDADFHVAVARWADELEQPDIALREWSLAHRDRPDDLEIAEQLAEAYLDAGRLEKAARCLKAITRGAPGDARAWQALIEVQRQLGQLEDAEQSRQQAAVLTGGGQFKTRVNQDDDVIGGHDEPEEALDEAFLVLFQEIFQGREGVYARQWVDPAGSTGYSPVRQPPSLQVVKNHLLGNHTVGIYPLRMDNTVLFAAFDLDLAPSVVRSCAPGSPGWVEAIAGLESYADGLQGRARHMGLTLHRADSGYKGLHLWAFFSEPVPAKQARQMCKAIAVGVTVPPVVRCEIFPKQSALAHDALGNLIKVPLGIHRKTGRRAWFTNAEGNWNAQRAYLQLASRISRDQLSHCQDVVVQNELARFDSQQEPSSEGLTVSLPSEAETYHSDSDVEFQVLLSRCVTLRALVSKIDQTGQLGHDEIRVLTHTVGHLATGPAAVNTLLARCLQTDPSLYLKRPLRGNPMSCASIRAKIPEVTANIPCDCRFSPRSGLYPTPGLHLSQATAALPLEQLQFQALLADFLRARKEVSRWTALLEGFSAKLAVWFDESGADEMQTSYGTLRRRRDDAGGTTAFELTV